MLSKALAAAAKATQPAYVEDVFQTWLYTGNGSTQTITNGVDLAGKGGLVWIKNRTQGTVAAASHVLHDSARGVTNYLSSNSTNQQFDATTGGVTAFNATGFDLGSLTRYNNFGDNYASWTFRKQAKFFDVVTFNYTSGSIRVPHSLGSVPGCIIVKYVGGTSDWYVYHRSRGRNYYSRLNQNLAEINVSDVWDTTDPTSTDFGMSNYLLTAGTWVAYVFAHDAGGFGASGNESVVKCGSFTSDGSGNATVDLGWEPQWLLFKSTSAGTTKSWVILDTMRGGSLSDVTYGLEANSSAAEGGGYGTFGWNPSATGFTFRGSLFFNETYIYIAIRRGPMKTPTDATKVFTTTTYTSTGTVDRSISGLGFSPDLLIGKERGTVNSFTPAFYDRLRGKLKLLVSLNTDAEITIGGNNEGTLGQNNFIVDGGTGVLNFPSPNTFVGWTFRRAPGFFDVVAYTGTGSATTVSHNLGVAPELMLIKARGAAAYWRWYWAPLGATKNFYMPNDEAAVTQTEIWNNTAPTSSVFTVGTSSDTNFSGRTYIAYLFASCPGVSKVGSYTGTGTTQQINCGFTAGSRFVLIKRTDSTGDWYVWDSARGIVAGNDPYLLLNSTAAEVTGTDYIDTYSAGFEISSTAPAAINANGGSFIFLAVA